MFPPVVLLGGLGMHARALAKIAATLYPNSPAALHAHSLLDLVSPPRAHARLAAAAFSSLAAFPGGAILHVTSGSAFFAVASGLVGAPNVRGVVLDSIPFARREHKLLRVLGVPSALATPLGGAVRALLTSPLIGATMAHTDAYFATLARADTWKGRPVLVATSADDVITPAADAREWAAARKAAWGAAGQLDVYEGTGKHACMARDDAASFSAAVREWAARTGVGVSGASGTGKGGQS